MWSLRYLAATLIEKAGFKMTICPDHRLHRKSCSDALLTINFNPMFINMNIWQRDFLKPLINAFSVLSAYKKIRYAIIF